MILRIGREMKGTQERNAMAVCLQNEEKNGGQFIMSGAIRSII